MVQPTTKVGSPAPNTVQEWEQQLHTSLEEGLNQEEAKQRLARDGFNELVEKKVNPILKFFSYFWGPIPWMIEVAAILSGILRHWDDFGIIMVLLLANAVVGFWEEYQAGNAIAALKAKLALQAKVKRAAQWLSIPARELVVGDLIRLRLGDIIPADAVLLSGEPVQVDQSAMTGESLPVTHHTGDRVYSGTILKQGEIDAFVVATGSRTFLGKTAQLVEHGETVSHFQKAVLKIGDFLIFLALILVGIIVTVALFRHESMMEVIQFALVLTVAAIPVAMPTVLSVTMAVGAKLLAAKQAIVTRLASIEEMAGIDILCSDKTGTLTKNQLTAGDPFCVGEFDADGIFLDAALASREEDQDPIDLAILQKVRNRAELRGFKIKKFHPFDPVSKRTMAYVEASNGKSFSVAKGAPQVILHMVEGAGAIDADLKGAIRDFAAKGYRSLGVARTNPEGKWVFEGIIPMFDPPREDSKEVIKTAQHLGVKVKMVTGDQLAIAKEIAAKLNLGTNILEATALEDTAAHRTGQMEEEIERADGFSQVYPEHKYHIVDVLQKRGHIVGMTGDGVNDAPALKKADAGIAVSNATDAARAAADIVLLVPGLSVIIHALREARRIFQRMDSYAIYRIAETIRVLLFMTLSILIFNFYPVTAVMIVLLALLNDGAILSIAVDNAGVAPRPVAWNMKKVLGISTLLGFIGVLETFGLFYLVEREFHLGREVIQTLIYLKLSVAGHLTIFVTRTRGSFWSSRPSNILLLAVIGTQAVATLISVYGILMHPIGWGWAGFVWGYAGFFFLVNDQVKKLGYMLFDPEGSVIVQKNVWG